MALKSRVFISCGQSSEEERNIAREIKERLERELNFDAYVAIIDHSVNSLTQNIFDKLEHSEYFLFLDFKREPINEREQVYRGSLFRIKSLPSQPSLRISEYSVFKRKVLKNSMGC